MRLVTTAQTLVDSHTHFHRASGAFAFHVLDVLLATEAAAAGGEQPIRSTVERPA